MNTLNKYDVQAILHHLNLLDGNMVFLETLFPTARDTLRNSRNLTEEIRSKILGVAITDVAVEPAAAEAA